MQIKRILLTGAGFVFLALGAIGIVFPIWPTTPFVMLSAACFTASPQLRARIMKISFFREHIENYRTRTGLRRKTVILSLTYLWGMLVLSMVLIRQLPITALLVLVGSAVTVHILWMARARAEERT